MPPRKRVIVDTRDEQARMYAENQVTTALGGDIRSWLTGQMEAERPDVGRWNALLRADKLPTGSATAIGEWNTGAANAGEARAQLCGSVARAVEEIERDALRRYAVAVAVSRGGRYIVEADMVVVLDRRDDVGKPAVRVFMPQAFYPQKITLMVDRYRVIQDGVLSTTLGTRAKADPSRFRSEILPTELDQCLLTTGDGVRVFITRIDACPNPPLPPATQSYSV